MPHDIWELEAVSREFVPTIPRLAFAKAVALSLPWENMQ